MGYTSILCAYLNQGGEYFSQFGFAAQYPDSHLQKKFLILSFQAKTYSHFRLKPGI